MLYVVSSPQCTVPWCFQIMCLFSKILSKKPQIATQSNTAYDGLMDMKVGTLVKPLEELFRNEPAQAVKN